MADQAILREYLVALGFRIDQVARRKFDNNLLGLDRRAGGLAKSLFGVATAAVAMTHVFARSMERLYYSSKYAETTVGNLQALEFGAKNIGLEGGRAASALKSMTQAIRSNPGLIGLLNSLGIEVRGRDKADVMIDLIGALKKMPSYIAERYASMFGIDPETLFYMQQGLDKMKETQAQRKRMAEEMGVDADAAAKVGIEYMTIWREVVERAGLFGQVLAITLLPLTREMAGVTNEVMKDWTEIVRQMQQPGNGLWQRLKEGVTGKTEGPRVTLTPEAKARIGEPAQDVGPAAPGSLGDKWNRLMSKLRPKVHGPRVAKDEAAVDAVTADRAPAREMPEEERVRRTQIALERQREETRLAKREAPQVARASKEEAERDEDGVTWRTDRRFDPQEHLAALEKKYALPPGLLDRVWKKESARGTNMVGPVTKNGQRARGHFQFMPDTQKEYGLKDPDDFVESSEAAARKWRDLLKRYNGDVKMAAAAYNWGDGNLAKFGLGRAPPETRDYIKDVAAPSGGTTMIEAKPEIHIHGVSNPREAAEHVIQQQRTVNADVVRNFSPKVR